MRQTTLIGEALLDLLLMIKGERINDVTVNSGLGHRSHEMEFKIPGEVGS